MQHEVDHIKDARMSYYALAPNFLAAAEERLNGSRLGAVVSADDAAARLIDFADQMWAGWNTDEREEKHDVIRLNQCSNIIALYEEKVLGLTNIPAVSWCSSCPGGSSMPEYLASR